MTRERKNLLERAKKPLALSRHSAFADMAKLSKSVSAERPHHVTIAISDTWALFLVLYN